MSIDMDASFSNAELAEILGRSSRFIIDWSERGLIEADIVPATGPGSRRRYSYPAVLRAALGVHLKERYGMSRYIVKDILDKISLFNFFTEWSKNTGFGCLSLFPLKDGGYRWSATASGNMSQINLNLKIKMIESEYGKVIGAIIVDLGFLKNAIDENIAAIA
jgi:hypothetical protein